MTQCDMIENCIFFNDKMPDMPEAAEVLKEFYCRRFHQKCARFVYKRVTNEVSRDLYPDDMARVARILGWDMQENS